MLAPVYDTQQSASQILSDITAITNSAVFWSGGLLKIIPYGDQPLTITFTPITISGTVAQGDLVFITFSGAFPGSPIMVSHYLTANDIISYSATMASLAAAITGNGTLADPETALSRRPEFMPRSPRTHSASSRHREQTWRSRPAPRGLSIGGRQHQRALLVHAQHHAGLFARRG